MLSSSISNCFRCAGVELSWRRTSRPGEATSLARAALNEGVDLVVAYGGDGTINEIISGMIGSEVPLGVLPGGTANVLARELNIPTDYRKAIQSILSGDRRRISLGRAGNRCFHLMAGIGLDAAVVASMPARLKRALGVYSFWIQGLRKLREYCLRPFCVQTHNRQYQATFAVIANARRYGGSLSVAPHADVFSDDLDVCLFHSERKRRFLLYLLAVYLGCHVKLQDVTYLKSKRVSVCGHSSIPVQVDGEKAGCLPMDFEILPDCLSVLIPNRPLE